MSKQTVHCALFVRDLASRFLLSTILTGVSFASRLTMTLDQIEQLSAARSQREGGQRLGTADSSPWQVGAAAVHHSMGT